MKRNTSSCSSTLGGDGDPQAADQGCGFLTGATTCLEPTAKRGPGAQLHASVQSPFYDERVVHQDACSGLSSQAPFCGRAVAAACRPPSPAAVPQPPAPAPVLTDLGLAQEQPLQVLLGTSAGLFALDCVSQRLTLLGLEDMHVGHVACGAGLVLACCPRLDDPESSAVQRAEAAAMAGLYALRLPGRSSDSSSEYACSSRAESLCGGSPHSSPARSGAPVAAPPLQQAARIERSSCPSSSSASGGSSGGGCGAGMPAPRIARLWHGNARCAAFGVPEEQQQQQLEQQQQGQQQQKEQQQQQERVLRCNMIPRIFVGLQPADILVSDDLGSSWDSCSLAAAPGAASWYRRLPPYEPCVRSICCLPNPPGSHQADTGEQQQQQQPQPLLLAGVEAGGVLARPEGTINSSSSSNSSNNSSRPLWEDVSDGLCKDIQALVRDPYSSTGRLFAVAGSGSMPGGLYRSRRSGDGTRWKRLFGYRYCVGLAVSAEQRGRLLLVSCDKPPDIGCHLYESLDGGRHWVNITDDVAGAVAAAIATAVGGGSGGGGNAEATAAAADALAHAPVVLFVAGGGVLLGCASGHVLLGAPAPGAQGGYVRWTLLAIAPGSVHSMCLATDGAVTASLSRS